MFRVPHNLLGISLLLCSLGCDSNQESEAQDCTETTVYEDTDGDGFGDFAKKTTLCVQGDQVKVGFALAAGDCKPEDVLSYPNSPGVCSDGVDDSCSGGDQECPETQPVSDKALTSWDCVDPAAAPDGVYAWATFDDGKGYYPDGACYYIFEGAKDVFYIKPHNMNPLKTSCQNADDYGCTCPVSVADADASDQRLYAYTLAGSAEACDPIILKGAASSFVEGKDGKLKHEQQALSNQCRRFAASLFKAKDDPSGQLPQFFFFAAGLDHLERRISNYPTLEVACAAAPDCEGADWSSLLRANFVRNDAFKKK